MQSTIDLLDRKLPADEISHLHASFPNAHIKVKAEERADVHLTVEAHGFPSTNKAYETWELSKFKARTANGTLRIETKTPPFHHIVDEGSLHISLTIPAQMKAELRAVASTIQASNLQSTAEIEIVGGQLFLGQSSGRFTIRAQSSAINLSELTDSALNIEMAAGSLTARSLQLKKCTLQASSAVIFWGDIDGTSTMNLSACKAKFDEGASTVTGTMHGGQITQSEGGDNHVEFHLAGTRQIRPARATR